MTHSIDKIPPASDEDGDEPTWDATDWCYMVKDERDEIVCICASRDEAEHIRKLLDTSPFKGA